MTTDRPLATRLMGSAGHSAGGRSQALGILCLAVALAAGTRSATAHIAPHDDQQSAAPRVAVAADSSKKLLVLRVYFANYSATSRYSTAEVNALMNDMNDLWRQTSYDATEMDFAVTELFQVPGDDSDYVDWSSNFSSAEQMSQLLVDAVGAAPDGTDFSDLDGLLVLMAETDPANWHRGRAGTYSVPIGEDGADVSLKSAIFVENPSDADVKVWGRWMHEIGHVFQVDGPAHPSKYDSNFELMDASYPGQSGVFEKLPTMGFPGWLPEFKYIHFTPDVSVGPAGAGLGGGLASIWAVEYDPDDSPSAQAVQAFVTDAAYYLVSFRRRILGDDLNSSFTPAGIPDEGVLIERVVEGGDPDSEDRWVTLMPPPGGDIDDLWQCGDVYTSTDDGVEIAIGREVVRELAVTAHADAWIRQGDATNHGSEQDLYAGYFSNPEGGFDGKFRSLVQFDLAELPANAVIESATLELRRVDLGGNQQVVPVSVQSVTQSWSEGTVIWDNQPAAAANPSASADVPPSAGTSAWDVTPMVEAWHAGAANHGLLLKAVSETNNAVQRRFRSSEYQGIGLGGSNPFKPRLRIVYSQVCPPEDTDPDRSYVRVSYDPGAKQPDVHISPWRVPPLNDWESTDVWVDSPVNGFGTYRYGTWASPYGDSVPYWNGDEPLVDAENRIVARVRNLGPKNATNVEVHFEITDPPGLGIADADGFEALGSVDSTDFPGLALIPPGGYTDVYVTYKPDVDISAQDIEDGFFVFHTCLRVRADGVAGETILGNQDGVEEQENMFWYEVPATDDAAAPPPAPFAGNIHLENFDPVNPTEFTLYQEPDLTPGWQATVNNGQHTVVLGPGAALDVPVGLVPPQPLPAVGSTARLDVAAEYIGFLQNDTLTGPHAQHVENRDLGGVTVVGAVVADTDTHCTASRSGPIVRVDGTLSAALGEPLRHASVLVRPSPGLAAGLPSIVARVDPDGTFFAQFSDAAGDFERADCLFGGTRRLGRSADADVPVPAGGSRPTPTAQPPAVVAILPPRALAGINDAITETVTYLGALPDPALFDTISLAVRFNPDILTVTDADPAAPGVQVRPGGALAGYAVLRNLVDNAAGTIALEAQRRTPTGNTDSHLMVIAFEGTAAGRSPVEIDSATHTGGRAPVGVEVRHGVVTITNFLPYLPFRATGRLLMPGRINYSGAMACAPSGCVRTDRNGDFDLPGVRIGDAITYTHRGHLTVWDQALEAPPDRGGFVHMGVFALYPGDVNGDLMIGFDDAVAVAQAAGTSSGERRYQPHLDLDGDGEIGRADVDLVAANWGRRSSPPDSLAPPRAPLGLVPVLEAARALHAPPPEPAGAPLRPPSATGALAPRAPQQAPVTVRAVPDLAQVVAGRPITVEIVAEDFTNLAAFHVELRVDPAVLAARDADPTVFGVQGTVGEVFPFGTFQIFQNIVENVLGRQEIAAGLLGDRPGVTGSGALARYVFDTLRPGGSDLRLVTAELRDAAWPVPADIPVVIEHGRIDVLPVPSATPTVTGTPPTAEPTTATPTGPTPTRTPEHPTPTGPTPTDTPASPTPTGPTPTGTPASPTPTGPTPTGTPASPTPTGPTSTGTPASPTPTGPTPTPSDTGTAGTPGTTPSAAPGAHRLFAPIVLNRAPVGHRVSGGDRRIRPS